MSTQVNSEESPSYGADKADATIQAAMGILRSRLREPGEALTSPDMVANYLKLRIAEREHEIFAALFLDNQHRVIAIEEMFRGSIDGASVYPREVVKAALHHNAAAVILAHNHPSGMPGPSQADQRITARLKEALALVDVRVLDHMVIGGVDHISFAERGIL